MVCDNIDIKQSLKETSGIPINGAQTRYWELIHTHCASTMPSYLFKKYNQIHPFVN